MKSPLFEQWFKDEVFKALPKGRVIMDTHLSIKRSLGRNCEKAVTDIDFSATVFAETQFH